MIHDRQRLPLRLEALHDRLVVHPGLDQLQGDLPPHRRSLFGQPDLAHAAFAKLRTSADKLKTFRKDLSRPPLMISFVRGLAAPLGNFLAAE
jgi:hypothetical protein